MRNRLVTAVAAWCLCITAAAAGERLKMTGPPAGQDAAEKLAGSLAAACNAGDFRGFMDHFTPAHGKRLRPRMEDLFVRYEPQMEIIKVTLLEETADTIVFGVRYAVCDKGRPETVLASKVTARRVGEEWKLDGEQVRGVTRAAEDSASYYGDAGDMPAPWNPFDPPAGLADPDLEHLRGDIGIRPGRGCANGRCAVN